MKSIFVILSMLDLMLTAALLAGHGTFMESNPLAAALYRAAGVPGLAILKVSVVLLVLGVHRVARSVRPGLATSLLVFAVAANVVAVGFGIYAEAVLQGRVAV